jgi:hypothetical protein
MRHEEHGMQQTIRKEKHEEIDIETEAGREKAARARRYLSESHKTGNPCLLRSGGHGLVWMYSRFGEAHLLRYALRIGITRQLVILLSKIELAEAFRHSRKTLTDKLKPKRLSKAVASIAIRRVLNTALKTRKATNRMPSGCSISAPCRRETRLAVARHTKTGFQSTCPFRALRA